MTDDPYVWPGTRVLRNKLGVRDSDQLDIVERNLVAQRVIEGVPDGDFDLAHLCRIHRHLFQDIYDWAGQIRTVEISKGGDQFQFRRFIGTGMADIHRRLERRNFLRNLEPAAFAAAAAEIMGDINFVHPFREGNGRTQLQYLKKLAMAAGHTIDLARLSPQGWIEASRQAHQVDYGLMASEIRNALSGS